MRTKRITSRTSNIFAFFAGLLMLSTFGAFAESYEKQCELTFKSYVSPSISGCVFSANQSGNLSFKLSGRSVDANRCFASSGLTKQEVDQLIGMIRDENFAGEKGTLFIQDKNGMLGGRLISNSFPEEGLILPQTRKSFDGSAELILDIGLVVNLDVKKIANIELNGDFGSIKLSGPCTKFTNETSASSHSLSKAKKECASLGFQAGTEKFGDCVMKLLP